MINKKISLIFCTPVNGGDLLLTEVLGEIIKNKFNTNNLSCICYKLNEFNKISSSKDLIFLSHLEENISSKNKIINKLQIIFDSTWIKRKIINFINKKKLIEFKKLILETDLIIACPGGYLNHFYSLDQKFEILEFIIKNDKKFIILAQSISQLHFWNENDRERLLKILEKAEFITLREGYDAFKRNSRLKNIYSTSDLAFLYQSSIKKIHSSRVKKVCINFRYWKDINQNREKIIDLLKLLDETLIEIHFLSTCQDICGYTDDWKFFENFIDLNALPFNIIYHKRAFETDVLIKQFASFDLIIGMRLHSCIMGILSGTPSINISYESKGKAIYQDINLENYVVSLEDEYNVWEKVIKDCILNYEKAFNDFRKARSRGYKLSKSNITLLEKYLA
ncbi:MAG TPA: polysaccharide pyruvyl transferase family protein [Saprospiraceae bacterium]|nr:polysaccharide pyruvyl transferase family protein [Saprospiraceae bacterium]